MLLDRPFDKHIENYCQNTSPYKCLIQKLCAHFPTITFYTIGNDLQLTRCSASETATDRAILLYISEHNLYVISSLKQTRDQPAELLSQTCLSLSLSTEQIDEMIQTQRNRTNYISSSQHISNPRNNTPADVPKNKSPAHAPKNKSPTTLRTLFRRQVSKAKHKWNSVKHRVSDKIDSWKRSLKEILNRPMRRPMPRRGDFFVLKPNQRGPRTPTGPRPAKR